MRRCETCQYIVATCLELHAQEIAVHNRVEAVRTHWLRMHNMWVLGLHNEYAVHYIIRPGAAMCAVWEWGCAMRGRHRYTYSALAHARCL